MNIPEAEFIVENYVDFRHCKELREAWAFICTELNKSAASEREIVVSKETFDELVNLAEHMRNGHSLSEALFHTDEMIKKIKTLAKQKPNKSLEFDKGAVGNDKAGDTSEARDAFLNRNRKMQS